jgi:SAM-dependent methyltransferase
MRSLVDGCEQRFGCLAKKTVLDIGCNDGSLLGFFREKGARTIGIEPTGAAEDAKQAGHEVYADYLSPDVASGIVRSHGYPDFITFTNVFAHIEDLDGVLASLRCLMADNTVVVIENHYLGSVLDGNQFDTFYHEHPRTYSYKSFSRMAATLGADILEVKFPSRYGGNIRVSFGRVNPGRAIDLEKVRAVERREAGFGDAFSVLRTNVERWRSIKSDEIRTLHAKYGKLRAKAFPGRAAILVKLLGLDEKMISAVYEKPGSLKVGHYLPGTRIEIHSDDELFSLSDQTQPILNLAWHIPTEIRAYLAAHGYSGQVVDVLSAEDFH